MLPWALTLLCVILVTASVAGHLDFGELRAAEAQCENSNGTLVHLHSIAGRTYACKYPNGTTVNVDPMVKFAPNPETGNATGNN